MFRFINMISLVLENSISIWYANFEAARLFQELEDLGAQVELAPNPLGVQKLPNGSEIPLPPILLGTLGNDPKKYTVSKFCV